MKNGASCAMHAATDSAALFSSIWHGSVDVLKIRVRFEAREKIAKKISHFFSWGSMKLFLKNFDKFQVFSRPFRTGKSSRKREFPLHFFHGSFISKGKRFFKNSIKCPFQIPQILLWHFSSISERQSQKKFPKCPQQWRRSLMKFESLPCDLFFANAFELCHRSFFTTADKFVSYRF